ncbi:hypothetical protein NN561_012023 [Cricetulus griseus]
MAGGPADVRKLFLYTTTQNYFGQRPELWDQPPLSSCPEVNNFLDDGNQMLLRVQRSDAGLAFSNTIDFDDTKDKVLVFFKLRPEVITDENLHNNILVSSMLESPINSLYQAVRQVFAPMLLKDQEWSRNFDPKLQNLLSELEAGLGVVLRRSDANSPKLKLKEDDTRGILTPSDEFQFWIEQAHRGNKQISKERASYFKELFETIAREFYNLDSLSLLEVVDLVETTRDVVDDVWRQTEHDHYPESRMLHLLDIIDFRLDFENRCRGIPGDASGPLSGKNLSEVVNNIVWVRQLELKVDDTIKIAEALLSDLSGFRSFHRSAEDLLDQFKLYEQEQFDDWSREVQSGLSDSRSDQQMIQSQRPMMLQSALAFEQIIKVVILMNIDLLRQQQRWKDGLQELRTGLASVAAQEWVVIGQVDMEALVEKHLFTVHDWEKNFKALKIKGKEVERLPRYEKLMCLCNSSCDVAAHIHEIDTFVTEAMKILTVIPQSVEEIGDTNIQYSNLQDRRPQILPLFQEAEDKNRLLRTVAGGGVETVSSLRAKWDKFELMMESHQLMIKDQIIIPILKYIRGEHLSPDHWLDLFRLLGLPRGTSLEKLLFGDLLRVADTIVEKASELKDLNSRAQGEVTIREALRELDLWGVGAVFSLIDYEDSQNRMIKLIKDWKDIVNQEKRSAFPRFYFIGDDDLLEILGQSTNPSVIQSHLKKLFAGINSVCFDEESKHITAMKSLEGEVVPFKNKVLLSNNVEGNASKLVYTPLTDKCYLTLTQAMKMGLGGNPYGPAGTGKTESVKALGGLLGRQVLVFNCDEGIDVKSMGRIFVGLVKCGAWGCFDEFNRLEEAVLSAVSMQIQTIQDALKNHRTVCELLGKEMKKALELFEQLRQRTGVVIVGPSGAGKSTLWRMLRAALCKIGKVVKQYTMNPKAMPRHQLLGHIDMDTREWSDGVLTNSARQVVREPQEVSSWIICDGDIDPEWIESLNSVLDDNRLLTMPSGERIQFGPNVNFVFETHDLSCASPATISRMGMIFLSAQTTSRHLLQKLSQTCMVISTNTGRVYRPKDCERLVLYLKDINLPKLDKWGTSTLVAFLQQDASEQKTELERLKQKIAEEVVKIEERKSKIDDELKEVQPLVNEAKLAVGNIRPESLSEIRSLRMPPDVIRDILEGVLRLMGIFDTSWVSMKSFLAKRGVREDIATFDARNIPKEIRESVEELLFKNKASFDPKNAKRASTAAAPLAAWVKANVQYSHVLERIQPLETEQSGLESYLLFTLHPQITWKIDKDELGIMVNIDSNFITALELAVRFGKTLIIQEVDGVEPVLYPLLRRDLVAQGPRYVVQIGDKIIDYNEDFRLFLSTRNPNPFIPPDAASIVTEVNFTTTRSGLRGQERDAYLPLAENASKMYFIISDLSKINNMYRFSLASFLRLFQRALHNKQVLVVQALRPDRLQSAMALFACKALGLKELSPLPLNLKRLYKETLNIEPILIIISPGADPSQELQELANAERSVGCYHQGWTKFYEFSLSDLRAGYNIIDRLFDGTKDVQWEFVHGLLENAIYGGRVDNCFDLRVLQSYLKQFFNSSVIDVLNERNKKSIFPYSISLPNSCSILNSNLIHQKVSPPNDRQGSPVLSFIILEQFNAIRLVQSVHQSLAALSKVIRGTTLLSSEVQKLASALLNQKCPLTWQSKWEGPEDPLQYLRGLVARALAIQNWVDKAEKQALLSDTLDLSELFHPDTFLNALRQETARAMGCSVDSLKFVASWKGRLPEAKLQIKISGLLLEGCSFDGNRLSENQHDSPSVSSVLPCFMGWTPQSTYGPYSPDECISLPVYTSAERDRVVTNIDVPCGGNQDQWIQCGAALFLKNQ